MPSKRVVLWLASVVAGVAIGFGIGAVTFRSAEPTVSAAPVVTQSPTVPPPSSSSPSGTMVVMPGLVGLPRNTAESIMTTMGLAYTVETSVPSDASPSDTVLSQTPPAGTTIATTRGVFIVVQCVPAPCPTPPPGHEIYDPCTCAIR